MHDEITLIEKTAYICLAIVIGLGILVSYYDENIFRSYYVVEDGVLEYFTAITLFITGMICLYKLLTDRHNHPSKFIFVNGIILALMVFGAGEEVSWGQRIFNIEAGEFFNKHNRQLETNLHNLEVNGVNINKLIFGKILTVFLVLYYLALPITFKKNATVRNFFIRSYLPVPKIHHGLVFLAAGLSILLVASSKKGELNEVCVALFFFLTIYRPQFWSALKAS